MRIIQEWRAGASSRYLTLKRRPNRTSSRHQGVAARAAWRPTGAAGGAAAGGAAGVAAAGAAAVGVAVTVLMRFSCSLQSERRQGTPLPLEPWRRCADVLAQQCEPDQGVVDERQDDDQAVGAVEQAAEAGQPG